MPARRKRRLTPEQAKALLEACRSHRLGALYTVAVCLGPRQGQLLGLHWADIDLEQRTIRLETSLTRVDGEYVLSDPKNEASSHSLPLPEPLVEVFRLHRDRESFERQAAGPLWVESGLVFTTALGAPLNRHVVTHQFQKLLPAASLPHMTFHDLR